MTESEIPTLSFLDEFKPLIRSGRKTATSRPRKYGKPGDALRTPWGDTLALMSVHRLKLSTIAQTHYMEEGFDSPEAFLSAWKRIHPRKAVKPDGLLYFHTFKLIEIAPDAPPPRYADDIARLNQEEASR